MNLYKIIYQCSDGYKDEVTVYAANRVMAFMIFEDFGYENVITVDCFRMLNKED